MSSSTDALSAILVELQKMNQRISSIESSKPSAPAAAGKTKKERKNAAKSTASAEDKPKRPANAWILFTQRVRGLLKENGYTKEAIGIEANMFSSTLKEENSDMTAWSDEDILARRADWSRPAVSKWVAAHGVKSKPNSVVSGEAPEEAAPAKKARKNPWEGLSEEQKAERIAKMKAGKAAKKAAAEGSAADAEEEAPVSPKVKAEAAPEAAPKASAPKEAAAKPSSPKASPKSNAAAAPAVAAAPSSGDFKPVLLCGQRYLVNMTSGHAYHRSEDGSQGDWAGIFSRTPKPHVDTSVPEPGAEEEELNFDDE
jgi:hypothetical protein